jgi:hypothetical protein
MERDMRRDAFTKSIEKQDNVKQCEAKGIVADSMEVRIAIMKRFQDGEITLEQAQKEINDIKRNAKKNGLITRSMAYNAG